MTEIAVPTFWRKWRPLLIFGGLMLGFLILIYIWSKYQEQEPVDPIYKDYLGMIAEASPTARAYEQKYFSHAGRDTVASTDFLMVCAGMVYAARREGVDPTRFSDNLTSLCDSSVIYINQDFFATR